MSPRRTIETIATHTMALFVDFQDVRPQSVDALIAGFGIDRCEGGGRKDLAGNMTEDRSVPLSYFESAKHQQRSCPGGNTPDKHTKSLLVRHVHQQGANDKTQALAVSNLVIV